MCYESKKLNIKNWVLNSSEFFLDKTEQTESEYLTEENTED